MFLCTKMHITLMQIQKQLVAEHVNGDDAVQFDPTMLASPAAIVLVPKFYFDQHQ